MRSCIGLSVLCRRPGIKNHPHVLAEWLENGSLLRYIEANPH
ncbi:hypothetical protein NBRC3257_2645 [Gluconobacter thailandicus NBRC 3257]|uniref:Transposase n=1 Tax=Gluconobacter thailandicus NBRC 3257 TaxID=1381097 RepID=A0ABQ0IZK4_GLUTH|nr:hypothetical protein NBRC3257_2645 [Gluconobacter thailandicus NBRC 3257]